MWNCFNLNTVNAVYTIRVYLLCLYILLLNYVREVSSWLITCGQRMLSTYVECLIKIVQLIGCNNKTYYTHHKYSYRVLSAKNCKQRKKKLIEIIINCSLQKKIICTPVYWQSVGQYNFSRLCVCIRHVITCRFTASTTARLSLQCYIKYKFSHSSAKKKMIRAHRALET